MQPKILLYDIETAPNLGYYFELYREGNILSVHTHWYIISFAWKWLGEKRTHVLSLPDFKTYKKNREDDKELCRKLWELFNEADIVIAHNGNSFDQKKSNARFIKHKFSPPSPYKQIDTKLVAKRHFRFDSNKLDDLGDYLGVGRKIQVGGKDTWMNCLAGNMKAWKKMCDYNKQDVILLEKVYLKLLPYCNPHPNMGMYKYGAVCPRCGDIRVHSRGFEISSMNKFMKYQCQGCGGWLRKRASEKIIKPQFTTI